MKKIFLIVSLLFFIGIMNADAQMTTRIVRDSLFTPWELVYGPDDHIWFTQKNGYICRLNPATKKIDTLYFETNTVSMGEGGMLGMALDPNFATQPYVYAAYNYDQNNYKERIVKYTYANNILRNPQILLDNIDAAGIHNGCRLVIVGDKLFISTGDAASSSIAQNTTALNGKILRINLDGSIPSDNPFSGSPVWSKGHRNAQGLVFANGKLYSSEHGPGSNDEFNIIMKGRNFGWPNVEGYCNTSSEINFCNDSNVVEPIMAWTPTIAVSGIDYYNHSMFPALQKSILMTTLKDQQLYKLKLNASFDAIIDSTVISGISFGRLRDICISPDGKIYISTSNNPASSNKIIEIYDPNLTALNNVVTENKIFIYPNPSKNNINIQLPKNLSQTEITYNIMDQAGKKVLSGKLDKSQVTIKTQQLSSGLYQIELWNKKREIAIGSFLKQ